MSVRTWATLGNVLRIFSLPLFLGSAVAGYRVLEIAQAGAPTNAMLIAALMGIVGFVISVLFWWAKGPLISGSLVARFLVGLYMLLWVISSLGFAVLVILVVYLFTSEPETYSGVFNRPKPAQPRFAPPQDWQANGRVGPSGAMAYSDADQGASVGVFYSGIPVQVTDKRNGLAQVVAASGERGWIDVRTLTEGV
jgi:hypothetical protein